MPRAISHNKTTQHGFEFGPMTVTRLHREEKHGVWLEIETDRERVTIRSTRTGFLRVFGVEKKGKR